MKTQKPSALARHEEDYIVVNGRRMLRVRGGEPTMQEIAAGLEAALKQVEDDRAAGKQVDETREAALKAEQARVRAEIEASAGGNGGGNGGGQGAPQDPMQELEQLRAYVGQQQMQQTADQLARLAAGQVQQQQQNQAQQLRAMMDESLAKYLGGAPGGDSFREGVVNEVMKQLGQPSGQSRAIYPGASPEVAAQLAAGGSYSLSGPAASGQVQVGSNREVDEIKESKSIARLFAIAQKVKTGIASEGEREFYAEQRNKALQLGTDSSGGFLVPPEFLDGIQELLQPYTTVRRAGVEEIPFSKSLAMHTVASEPVAYYVGEIANTTPSEMTFGEVALLTPKELTALVPVSNRLLNATNEAETQVRGALARSLGLREDLAFLQGAGGTEPTGFRNMTGVTSNPLSVAGGSGRENGFYPSIADLRRIRAKMRRQNPVNPRPVWIFHIDVLTNFETLVDSDGRPLLESSLLRVNEDGVSGVIDNVPFYTTTQIPTNITQGTDTNTTYLLLVNMNEALIGLGQDMEIEASGEASYTTDGGSTHRHPWQTRETVFRAGLIHDINHRRKPQVLIQYGIKLPA